MKLQKIQLNYKTNGFNIEGSHVCDHARMSNLFMITDQGRIAYVWCYHVELYIHQNIKPIRVLKHKRRLLYAYSGMDWTTSSGAL